MLRAYYLLGSVVAPQLVPRQQAHEEEPEGVGLRRETQRPQAEAEPHARERALAAAPPCIDAATAIPCRQVAALRRILSPGKESGVSRGLDPVIKV